MILLRNSFILGYWENSFIIIGNYLIFLLKILFCFIRKFFYFVILRKLSYISFEISLRNSFILIFIGNLWPTTFIKNFLFCFIRKFFYFRLLRKFLCSIKKLFCYAYISFGNYFALLGFFFILGHWESILFY